MLAMDIKQQIENLKDRQRRRQAALKMRLEKNLTLREIGEELGVTRERARQLIAEAIKELKGGK